MWTRWEEYVRIVTGGVLSFLRTPIVKRRAFMHVFIIAFSDYKWAVLFVKDRPLGHSVKSTCYSYKVHNT